MSKAFTSEENDDDAFDNVPSLPPGTRNYMTLKGAEALRQEVDALDAERRGLGSDMKGRARAQTIGRRLRYLVPRLDALERIDPLAQPKDRILFGATVTVASDAAPPETWRIVGVDEVDLNRGWISWMSPLAGALLEKRIGDAVSFMGRRLVVREIVYEP